MSEPSNLFVFERKPYPGLSKALENGELYPEPWLPILMQADQEHNITQFLNRLRYSYKWQIPVAEIKFGKPDCYFKGHHRYAVYHFSCRKDDKEQCFVLWCDPKKAGKGSNFELIQPIDPAFIEPIGDWLATQHPDYKLPGQ